MALKWRRNGEVSEWNPVFACATLEMGIGVELCWPYRAQEKGAVENLVGFVKGSFFKVRRFEDLEDLEQQLGEWHREVNEERPCRATGVIPAARLAEEAPRLRPLKVRPEELALRIPVYVGPTGTVMHDGHAYSMPPEAISMPGTLYLYAHRVRIVGFLPLPSPAPGKANTAPLRCPFPAWRRRRPDSIRSPRRSSATSAPRSGSFAAGDGGGTQGGDLQRRLRGELPATFPAFPGGCAVKGYDRGISTAMLPLLPRERSGGAPPRQRRLGVGVRGRAAKLFPRR